MEDFLIRQNLRWTGHLLRMATDRLPRQVLYWQLPEGQRPRDLQHMTVMCIIFVQPLNNLVPYVFLESELHILMDLM